MTVLKLFIKDFRATGVYQLLCLAALFITSIAFIYVILEEKSDIDPGLPLYFLFVILSCMLVSLLFMKVDEIYQTDETYASLPVKRSEMVLAKYATSSVQILLAIMVHFLGAHLGFYLQGSNNYRVLNILNQLMPWLSILVMIILIRSFSFPFYFKFGLSKGVAINLIVQFILIVIAVLNFRVLNPVIFIQECIEWLSNQNIRTVVASFTSLFLVILSGSILLSIRLYNSKDL